MDGPFIPYVKVYANLPDHPKTFALAKALSLPRNQVIGMLVNLWAATLYSTNGNIDYDPAALAKIMDWDNDPSILVNALVAIHWIDRLADNWWRVHNWGEYYGAPAARYG